MESARAVSPSSFSTEMISLLAGMLKNHLPDAADYQNQSEEDLMAQLGRLRQHGAQHKLADKALTKFTGETALNALALWRSAEEALDGTRRQLEDAIQRLRTAEELQIEAEARSTRLQNENDQLRDTQPAVEIDPGEGPDLRPLEEYRVRQAELQQECDDLRRCVQEGAGQLSGLRDELAEARCNLDRSEEKAQGLADELLQLKERSRRQEERRRSLQQAQDDLRNCLLRTEDEKSGMGAMRDRLRERLRQEEETCRILQRRCEELERARGAHEEELEEAHTRLGQVQTEQCRAAERYHAHTHELEAQLENLLEVNRQLRHQASLHTPLNAQQAAPVPSLDTGFNSDPRVTRLYQKGGARLRPRAAKTLRPPPATQTSRCMASRTACTPGGSTRTQPPATQRLQPRDPPRLPTPPRRPQPIPSTAWAQPAAPVTQRADPGGRPAPSTPLLLRATPTRPPQPALPAKGGGPDPKNKFEPQRETSTPPLRLPASTTKRTTPEGRTGPPTPLHRRAPPTLLAQPVRPPDSPKSSC